MGILKKIIGRSVECDYVILDPQKRVSRFHLEIIKDDDKYYIKDLASSNGTYINGIKIPFQKTYLVDVNDVITMSKDYHLDISNIFETNEVEKLDDSQKFSLSKTQKSNKIEETDKTIINDGNRTIVFEKDRVNLSEISDLDKSPYKNIGRMVGNDIVINKPNLSRNHCRIRLINPMILEIEDLGSTNGTFVDEERLNANNLLRFSSNVQIRLGSDTLLDLRKIFQNIIIVDKSNQNADIQPQKPLDSGIIKIEQAAFNDLEEVWKEYVARKNGINNSSIKYMFGGSLIGSIGMLAFGGPAGLALSLGGGVLGRYLGQQKTNKLNSDSTYEDMFLQVYCCPRCKESFQKKPWITIRDCFKCKLKFR
jgi:pSer/pThr/pTyr-binding forkhead associated (FHA) protein